jgi:nicotinate-nucleotide adenylyltransferase
VNPDTRRPPDAAAPPREENRPPRRIGLFGGTFDPPHRAHLALAYQALDALALDELLWIPAGQPWQKARRITAAAHRVAMVELAIAAEPRFRLERCEVDRTGPSYTLDTVRELQAREAGALWFLVIGQDQFAGLHTWQGWQELLQRVTLAVANRPGAQAEPAAEVRAALLAGVQGANARSVPLPLMDVASTEVRARAAAGRDITELVPPAVAGYIDRHHLYRPAPG